LVNWIIGKLVIRSEHDDKTIFFSKNEKNMGRRK